MRVYGFLRLGILYGIVFVPIMILLLKMRISKFRNILFVVTFFLVGITSFASRWFPVENLFLNFNSPESALTYFSGSIDEVIDVVNGENSCLVFYDPHHTTHDYKNMKNGTYSHHLWYTHNVIYKSSKGYKLPSNISQMPYYTKRTRYNFDEDGVFYAYHSVETNDYYLYGTTDLVDNEFEIVYGYSNSYDGLESNLKRVHVTIREDGSLHWVFVE